MNLATAAATFALVFPAELPDKTFIASLVLSARGRPLQVYLGVALAFTVHVGIAVAAGGLFALLPHRVVDGVVAVMFAAGAAWCWLVDEKEQEDKGERAAAGPTRGKALLSAFVVIFVAEWGDLTQIVTAQLAAKYKDPLSVGVGALLALWIVAAVAVVGGRGLTRLVPLALVRRVTGVVLAGFAVASAVAVFRN